MRARRSITFAVTAAAVSLLTQFGGPAIARAAEGSPRTRALHVTKECSQYTGAAGSYCTITSSNVPEIRVGMKVVYEQAATADFALDSRIVVAFAHGSAAHGHVVLEPGGSTGTVTIHGGTGNFHRFRAHALVTCSDDVHCAWNGTYTFGS